MSWISGVCYEGSRGFNEPPDPHLITVAELIQAQLPLCAGPGPAWSRCCREHGHFPPCAALGTDGVGRPVVVTWYRPAGDQWPLTTDAPTVNPPSEPGA